MKVTIARMFSEANLPVRPPAVAGGFYPAEKKILSWQVDELLGQVSQPLELRKTPAILIVPHAGYQYSGSVAATGFRRLVGSKVERVILLGVSHQAGFGGAAVFERGFWETPLGRVALSFPISAVCVPA